MRLYVVDAGSLFGWCFFAHKDEPEDGGLKAVDNWLWNFRAQMKPTHLVMCLDAGNVRRTAIDPEYKLGRKTKPKPEGFIEQLRQLPDVMAASGVPCVRIDGEEADDVIASIVARHVSESCEVIVCSTDKDLTALVGENVRLYDPKPTPSGECRFWDASGVVERMGVPPHRVPDLLAMWGDTADGVQGIKGIGETYAKAALQQTRSMSELFRKAAKGELQNLKPATQKLLAEGREQYEHALKLVTLCKTLDVPSDLEAFRIQERRAA
jgi:5'-3' exonuclease